MNKPLVTGLFRLQDQHGLPVETSLDLCRERGVAPDYCEMLCSAWLNDCLKFDSFIEKLELAGGSHVKQWKEAGAAFFSRFPEALRDPNPIDVFCRAMLAKKGVIPSPVSNL